MTDTARRAGRMDPGANAVETWAWPTPWIERPDRAGFIGRRPAEVDPLFALHVDRGQSPWLDQLTRKDIVNGRLSRLVAAGLRGVTVNREILASALATSPEYAEQLSWLLLKGCTVEEAYWELAATDVQAACAVLGPVFEDSHGEDGFVSVDIATSRAGSTTSATEDARRLHDRIDRPNLLVGIPASPWGVPALQATVAAGRNTNATSILSIDRYSAVIDAYVAGLEMLVRHGGDPATVHGTASFCLDSIAADVDRGLLGLADDDVRVLSARDASARARVAYQLFEERFSSQRWERLARRGAHPQRLLWTSSGRGPAADARRRYDDDVVAPRTIHAVSESAVTSPTRGRAEAAGGPGRVNGSRGTPARHRRTADSAARSDQRASASSQRKSARAGPDEGVDAVELGDAGADGDGLEASGMMQGGQCRLAALVDRGHPSDDSTVRRRAARRSSR